MTAEKWILNTEVNNRKLIKLMQRSTLYRQSLYCFIMSCMSSVTTVSRFEQWLAHLRTGLDIIFFIVICFLTTLVRELKAYCMRHIAFCHSAAAAAQPQLSLTNQKVMGLSPAGSLKWVQWAWGLQETGLPGDGRDDARDVKVSLQLRVCTLCTIVYWTGGSVSMRAGACKTPAGFLLIQLAHCAFCLIIVWKCFCILRTFLAEYCSFSIYTLRFIRGRPEPCGVAWVETGEDLKVGH